MIESQPDEDVRRRPSLGSRLLLTGAVVFALAGIAAFILLFVRRMNVYWFILSPLILAVYEIPAVVLVWLWKRGRKGKGSAGS